MKRKKSKSRQTKFRLSCRNETPRISNSTVGAPLPMWLGYHNGKFLWKPLRHLRTISTSLFPRDVANPKRKSRSEAYERQWWRLDHKPRMCRPRHARGKTPMPSRPTPVAYPEPMVLLRNPWLVSRIYMLMQRLIHNIYNVMKLYVCSEM